jgi:hypothetical protein
MDFIKITVGLLLVNVNAPWLAVDKTLQTIEVCRVTFLHNAASKWVNRAKLQQLEKD